MKKIDNIIISIVLSIPVLFVICFFLWANFFGPNRQELFMAESLKLSFSNGAITSASDSHIQKAIDGLNKMRKLLKGNLGKLSEADRKIAFEIIEDLTNVTGLKW